MRPPTAGEPFVAPSQGRPGPSAPPSAPAAGPDAACDADPDADPDQDPGATSGTAAETRADRRQRRLERRLAAEGLLEPAPLTEVPPHDRYCDLVLTGGVASGVAYPWAVVELARHYRFRHIGGTSVGAVAAALAAASEYGRCMQVSAPFEVMRQVPVELAAPSPSGQRTTLLGLFQPTPAGQRLFGLLVALLDLMSREPLAHPDPAAGLKRPWWQRLLLRLAVPRPDAPDRPAPDGPAPDRPAPDAAAGPGPAPGASNPRPASEGLAPDGLRPLTRVETLGFALRALRVFLPEGARQGLRLATRQARRVVRGAPVLALVAALAMAGLVALSPVLAALVGGAVLAVVGLVFLVLGLVEVVQRDLTQGVVDNGMGLCTGLRQPGSADPGIVDWLHEGIQRAAGLRVGDPPLTFRDLWEAPQPFPTSPAERQIRLEVMVTNVTLGRPYRFPLEGEGDRLWYRPQEWASFFPPVVLRALEAASEPYRPRSDSDPDDPGVTHARELPVADLPVVVAARMSMSFPVLFSCVPVYAMDYEAPRERRRLRPCQLSDGGLCSNFPIHLFDAAIPRWPTFGLWLTRRLKDYPDQGVWLPRTHLEGRADTFRQHLDRPRDPGDPRPVARLAGFGLGVLSTMKDWSDHTRIRLPHVRNRVARIRLRPGEGQLFITMGPQVIRRMAWSYGTEAGRKLVAAFGADPRTGEASPAWRDHLYVRLQVLLTGLQELLHGAGAAVRTRAHSLPVRELLDRARQARPLQDRPHRVDPCNAPLRAPQRQALDDALAALSALETELGRTVPDMPYRPSPQPELRLRPPL